MKMFSSMVLWMTLMATASIVSAQSTPPGTSGISSGALGFGRGAEPPAASPSSGGGLSSGTSETDESLPSRSFSGGASAGVLQSNTDADCSPDSERGLTGSGAVSEARHRTVRTSRDSRSLFAPSGLCGPSGTSGSSSTRSSGAVGSGTYTSPLPAGAVS